MSVRYPRNVADGPATIHELVTEARAHGLHPVTERLVRDWTEIGLLARPEFRKSSRHGSDPALYPPGQRRLFLHLLCARGQLPQSPRHVRNVLVRMLITGWLHQFPFRIPTSQARRALRTMTLASRCLPSAYARRDAEAVVTQVAHSSAPERQRRLAVQALTECMQSGVWEWGRVHSVLTVVCSPWSPVRPGCRVERGLEFGGLPTGIDEVVAALRSTVGIQDLLRTESVREDLLDEARATYFRKWGQKYLLDFVMLFAASMEEPPPPTPDLSGDAIGGFLAELAYVVNQA
ncbi:hypothetical protein ACFYXF_45185 [Streptomyces sp. NPDC002680]|uniref:hypothetical protein n=1 Tax=Streptomyces sp. NPDC002680 TaxID=3364659 RepID=UPI0036795FDF